jgi:hypothetical protein
VDSYWTAGPSRYTGGPGGALAPGEVTNGAGAWRSDLRSAGFVPVPADAADPALRTLTAHVAAAQGASPSGAAARLRTVGTFDPTRIDVGGPMDPAGFGPFLAGGLPGADPASRALLGGQPLLPNSNPAGYPAGPAGMLIPLSDIGAFTDPARFTAVAPQAPISVIRVRVDGVTGVDAVSRERVRVVADAIARRTGLSVQVVLGASTTAKTIDLPAGTHGRPPLRLTEMWVRNGVATAIITALDRESLALFVAVMVVCALFVGNATTAATRVRADEIVLLHQLGWRRGRVVTLLLAEVGLLAMAAGVIATGLSTVVGAVVGLDTLGPRAVVVVPAAALVALAAALPAAWRAGRPPSGSPPSVRPAGRPHLRGLSGLAVANLLRVPRRSALGAAAVGVGGAALTVLLSVRWTFHGALVGSILGDAVSVQVRSVDYVSVAVTLLMSAIAVADVGYLNLADRRGELAVLITFGWRRGLLLRLFATEAAMLGLAGSLAGTATGLGLAVALSGSVPVGLLWAALVAVPAGTLLTVLAMVVPLRMLRRLGPTAQR